MRLLVMCLLLLRDGGHGIAGLTEAGAIWSADMIAGGRGVSFSMYTISARSWVGVIWISVVQIDDVLFSTDHDGYVSSAHAHGCSVCLIRLCCVCVCVC